MNNSDIWYCYVGDLKASNGITYIVTIERAADQGLPFFERTRMTPHEFKERWKAEYEVACWDAFLNGKPYPDLLNFGKQGQDNEQQR